MSQLRCLIQQLQATAFTHILSLKEKEQNLIYVIHVHKLHYHHTL